MAGPEKSMQKLPALCFLRCLCRSACMLHRLCEVMCLGAHSETKAQLKSISLAFYCFSAPVPVPVPVPAGRAASCMQVAPSSRSRPYLLVHTRLAPLSCKYMSTRYR